MKEKKDEEVYFRYIMFCCNMLFVMFGCDSVKYFV